MELSPTPYGPHFVIVRARLLSEGSKYHCVFFSRLT